MDRTLNTDIDVIDRFVIFSFLSQEDLNFFTCLQQGEINDTAQNVSQSENMAESDNHDMVTTQQTTKMVQKCSDSQYQSTKPSSSETCENQIKRNRKVERKLLKKNQSSTSGVSVNSTPYIGRTKALHDQNRKLKKGGKNKLQASRSNKPDRKSRSVANREEDIHDITKRKHREKEFRKKQNQSNSLIGRCMQSLTDARSSSSKSQPIKRWCVTCPEDQLLHERRKNSNIRLRFQAEHRKKAKLVNAISSIDNNNEQSPQPALNNVKSTNIPISGIQRRDKRDRYYDKNQDNKNVKGKIIYSDFSRRSTIEIDKVVSEQSRTSPTSSNCATDIDTYDIGTSKISHANTLSVKENANTSNNKKLKFHTSQVESMKSLYSKPSITYTSDTDTSDLSRKVTHNKKERERRSKQKNLFFYLQQSHPDLIRLDKCPKIKVLRDAVDLIHNLCNEEKELVNIKLALRDKNAKLRGKLEQLRCKLNLVRT